MKLREQGGLDPRPGLVAGPQPIAERFDDVVGRHADVRSTLLEHLQDRVQHADHGPEGLILAFAKAAQAVKMPEQLVRAVNQVYQHSACPYWRRGAHADAAAGIGLPDSHTSG